MSPRGGGGKTSLEGDKVGGTGGKPPVGVAEAKFSGVEIPSPSELVKSGGFLNGGWVTGSLPPPIFKLGLVPGFLPNFGVIFNLGFPIGGRVIPGWRLGFGLLLEESWLVIRGCCFLYKFFFAAFSQCLI